MKPILQVALDFLELKRALKAAQEAVKGGATWIEAGTPLIKSEGLDSIRALRREFPKHTLIADLKTMDAGRIEMEAAAKAGANIGMVLGVASDECIKECIEAGRNYGLNIGVDLVGHPDPGGRARMVESWGAYFVSVHCPIDEQMAGRDPLDRLKKVRAEVKLPVACAGGINSETAAEVVEHGADIVIVGGAITKAADAEKAARDILHAIETRTKVRTDLFKRASGEEVRDVFRKVSTPNLSDAMHRAGDLPGVIPVLAGAKMVGPAFTVRTYAGDWAKPVEAIELAQPGDVLVIDVGGVGPAVWGELASEGALQRKLSGVVIDGAIRDVDSIRAIGFPGFARIITPTAGEPKGFGEVGVTVKVFGVSVSPGDWVVGDDNGVVVVPRARAVEVANRAMDVLERENRLREEIRRGSTLSEVTELLRWEKQKIMQG